MLLSLCSLSIGSMSISSNQSDCNNMHIDFLHFFSRALEQGELRALATKNSHSNSS